MLGRGCLQLPAGAGLRRQASPAARNPGRPCPGQLSSASTTANPRARQGSHVEIRLVGVVAQVGNVRANCVGNSCSLQRGCGTQTASCRKAAPWQWALSARARAGGLARRSPGRLTSSTAPPNSQIAAISSACFMVIALAPARGQGQGGQKSPACDQCREEAQSWRAARTCKGPTCSAARQSAAAARGCSVRVEPHRHWNQTHLPHHLRRFLQGVAQPVHGPHMPTLTVRRPAKHSIEMRLGLARQGSADTWPASELAPPPARPALPEGPQFNVLPRTIGNKNGEDCAAGGQSTGGLSKYVRQDSNG